MSAKPSEYADADHYQIEFDMARYGVEVMYLDKQGDCYRIDFASMGIVNAIIDAYKARYPQAAGEVTA
jgi:hypothetical protein